jgi:hypothetical protein
MVKRRGVRGDLIVVVDGLPGHSDGREVRERREEIEGNRLLSSPRAKAVQGGRSTGGSGLRPMRHWQRWWGAQEREGGDLRGAWRGEERCRAIYSCGEAVEWPGSSARTTCC